ncbi:UNVERIFIED_CONTAM: hypothetical protein Sangu_2958800, partial [Sesamum angustifolium]
DACECEEPERAISRRSYLYVRAVAHVRYKLAPAYILVYLIETKHLYASFHYVHYSTCCTLCLDYAVEQMNRSPNTEKARTNHLIHEQSKISGLRGLQRINQIITVTQAGPEFKLWDPS